MKKSTLTLLFFIYLFFFLIKGLFAITPDDVIWRAYEFADLHWYCDSNNIVSPYDPGYHSEFSVGWYYGIAYKWGGYDDEDEFVTKIDNGYAAGYPWNDRVVDWACGIDCSGLVSHCWALAWKHGTWDLDDISSPIPWDSLKKGDIVLKPGSHVIIFEYWLSADRFWGIDASTAGEDPARVRARDLDRNELANDGYSPKRYKNFITPPIPPGSQHMTWGQIKAMFSGSWSEGTGFSSYGAFYGRGIFGTGAGNYRRLFWNNFDPDASGYVAFKSLPTNSDYFSFFNTTSKGGIYGEYLDSSKSDLFTTKSDFLFSDPLYDGGGAPYFYKVASYFDEPFQLNQYSDEVYTKSIGIGMDSVANYSDGAPWTTHFELATINGRDYIFFPSMQDDSIAIYDVTDIQNRQKVGAIGASPPFTYVTDVAVKDTFCFTTLNWQGLNYVMFSNVANPTSPRLLDFKPTFDFIPLKLEIGNQRIFVFCTDNDSYHNNQYVVKFNVIAQRVLYPVGFIQVGDHDHPAKDMIVAEPYFYVSRENSGLAMYECAGFDYVASYPVAPLDTVDYNLIDHQDNKIYAIRNSPNGGYTDVFLDIIDVSDPAHAFLLSSCYILQFGPLDLASPGGLCIQGDYVYFNNFEYLSIFDVSNATDVHLTERIKPVIDIDSNSCWADIDQGEVIAEGNKVFGLVAHGSVPSLPISFSGFYTVQTFGLETDVIVIGDANANGSIEIGDILFLLYYLFRDGPRPFPYSLGEVNGDGAINVGDAIYLINYLFKGGSPPTKVYAGPSENRASISLGKCEANMDNVFDIPIICEANGPVAGVQLEIDYDPGEIELLPPVLTTNTRDLDLFYSDDHKKIGFLDLTGRKLIPNGEILKLRFKSKKASSTLLSIKLSQAILAEPLGRILKVEILNYVADTSTKPNEFRLSQNCPNPFNPTTVIDYALPSDCKVKVVIYNILGQRVRTLIDSYQKTGYQRIIWDGKNDEDKEVASGIYFYKLEAGEFNEVKKMIMIK